MPREANAIDFWRGFALVSIFVNHIPGIYYERVHAPQSVDLGFGRAVRASSPAGRSACS